MMPGANTSHPAYLAMQDWLKDDLTRAPRPPDDSLSLDRRTAAPIRSPASRCRIAFGDRRALPARAARDRLPGADRAARTAVRRRRCSGDAIVHITSPGGTDLRFRAGDRPVNLQDGDASQARAAQRRRADRQGDRVAGGCGPHRADRGLGRRRDRVSAVAVGRPARRGLKLRFAKGRVVDVTATSGKEAAEAEIRRAGDAGRTRSASSRSAFNPLLAVPERAPWIPYYGYGAGVVRLSLGDNTELGGTVTGGYVRWNFFTDLTVTVGSTTWVRAGRSRCSAKASAE